MFPISEEMCWGRAVGLRPRRTQGLFRAWEENVRETWSSVEPIEALGPVRLPPGEGRPVGPAHTYAGRSHLSRQR